MPTRTPSTRTPLKRPLIDSPYVLRVLATGVALSTFTGISAFAATHVQNANAPLQPSAIGSAPTPAPTAATTTTRRTTITSGITTTTTPARTRTRSS